MARLPILFCRVLAARGRGNEHFSAVARAQTRWGAVARGQIKLISFFSIEIHVALTGPRSQLALPEKANGPSSD